MYLEDGKLVPITCSFGFIEAPPSVVAQALLEWQHERLPGAKMEIVNERNLASAILCLEPLTTPPVRELILKTNSNWTAYLNNGCNGPDVFGPVSYLALRLGCRGVTTMNFPHTIHTAADGIERGSYGAIEFAMYDGDSHDFLNLVRSVRVSFDEKWSFEAIGIPQEFEDLPRYSAKRVRDRFTAEMLFAYCEAIGIRLNDESFYVPVGFLLNSFETMPEGYSVCSLQEARSRLGV